MSIAKISPPHRIALFSLNEPSDGLEFARELLGHGWRVVATQNVADTLAEAGIQADEVSQFLGIQESYPFPPTLHPKMELALTTFETTSIDLVFDTTYPLSKGNDVGGHTLLALAAKGNRIVVSNWEDMDKVVRQLLQNENEIEAELRERLIVQAYEKISNHYQALAYQEGPNHATPAYELMEGENPYQAPAHLLTVRDSGDLGLGKFQQLSGIKPCFTNMADLDSLIKLMCALVETFIKNDGKAPYITIAAKHGNPCGLSLSWDVPEKSVDGALFGNPRAIWGGEVVTNFAISEEVAYKLFQSQKRNKIFGDSYWMLDLVAAPEFQQDAIRLLGKRSSRKLFQNPTLFDPRLDRAPWAYRPVRGGYLRQPPNHLTLNWRELFDLSGNMEKTVRDSIVVAWAVAWHSNHGGNEVSLVYDRNLLAVGGGPSTVDAIDTALQRAKACGHDLAGSVFAADAFFPFTDAPEILAHAGCAYGIVPKGGKNFEMVKELFTRERIEVLFLPEEYRGFCRH
jgi:phosphoribosylaminoimidazolecarboxamide formyltransferase/IMP cyclohydrolase